jgi:hypothetical protein
MLVAVADDEILVHVDRNALGYVHVVSDYPLEGAGDTCPVAGSVHHYTAVAFVGDDEVVGTVEAQPPRFVELTVAGADMAAESACRFKAYTRAAARITKRRPMCHEVQAVDACMCIGLNSDRFLPQF